MRLNLGDSVMSDSDESGVTHTEISSPYEDLSDIGRSHLLARTPELCAGVDPEAVRRRMANEDLRERLDIEADEEDEDDEMDVEIDEEEHLAPAYPVVVALPATAPSAEETGRLKPISVKTWLDFEFARLLAISSPQHHLFSPWSSSPLQIPVPLSTT
ncbi:hypothetical protein Tco_1501954 [Tanacetum coccineum]